MIRLVYCVSRREDISIEEFRRLWKDERYVTLLREYGTMYKTKGMKKNLVLKVPMNSLIIDRQGTGKPYDGVIEMWWDSARELLAVNEMAEADEMRRKIGEYEKQFIDKTRSTIFFTEYLE